MVKPSRFNFWARLSADRHLLFNGVTGALYELNDQERQAVLRLLQGSQQLEGVAHDDLVRLLYRGGFLISDQTDEVAQLVQQFEHEARCHRILDITVSPTYECNFRCRYCYVQFQDGRMDADIEQRVVRFIGRQFERYQVTNLTWFGGEPLLCLETVLRVSSELRSAAARMNVHLIGLIATNGYLLGLKTAQELCDAGVTYFHVTVDGSQVCHDRLRVLADGRPSWTRIMENIRTVLENVASAELTLRMNVSEETVASAYQALDEIPLIHRGRVQLNVMPIIWGNELPKPGLFHSANQVIKYALTQGYQYYDMQISPGKRCFCNATKLHNYQIGPDGGLYKCSPSGKPEVHVGQLNNEGIAEYNEKHALWHENADPKGQCLHCPYLCFCFGGCRLDQLRGVSQRSCRARYQDMEGLILSRYVALQGKPAYTSD